MKDAKRYKLCQDVCYDDGAFVIPAGQVMVREADYDALRDERDRLAKALKALVSEVGSYTVERQYYSREEASKDLDRREKALLAQLQQAKAALTPAGGQQGEGK